MVFHRTWKICCLGFDSVGHTFPDVVDYSRCSTLPNKGRHALTKHGFWIGGLAESEGSPIWWPFGDVLNLQCGRHPSTISARRRTEKQ
eukprot:symbB.v1.2.029026.t1/scaffold3130.1/size80623/2